MCATCLRLHFFILLVCYSFFSFFFFFNDTATTEIYTLSLHDALPIYGPPFRLELQFRFRHPHALDTLGPRLRSEEHTSELQSHSDLVCRLLLEKKKKIEPTHYKSEHLDTLRRVEWLTVYSRMHVDAIR